MTRTRITALFAVLALTMALATSGAVAEQEQELSISAPATAVCEGTAEVTPGLHFPGVGDGTPVAFEWTFNTTCDVSLESGGNVDQVTLKASGTGEGWCGQSEGTGGSGTIEDSKGNVVSLSNITWATSAGGTFVVDFNHDAGSTGQGVAEVQATGGADCINENGATTFQVEVAGELL